MYRAQEGILTVADGPIMNCTITGYETGFRNWGQQPGCNMWGCRFESCATGLAPNTTPGGFPGEIAALTVSGCTFNNCGTAVLGIGGSVRFVGNVITGTNGAAPGGTNPQYGINMGASGSGGLVAGVTITGQFDIAGIAIAGGSNSLLTLHGCEKVTNTGSGVAWSLPSTLNSPLTAIGANYFIGCNKTPVYVVSQLPVQTFPITAAIWGADAITSTALPINADILGPGFGYVPGTYTAVSLIYFPGFSGPGSGATANITVDGTGAVSAVTITNPGSGYFAGFDILSANNSSLGGSGAGFSYPVLNAALDIFHQGSGYVTGFYFNVPLTGGTVWCPSYLHH